MRAVHRENKTIIQIEEISIITADTRQMRCKNITVHLEGNNIILNDIDKTIRWWSHWMGHIFFSRDIIHARTSYSGAIRLAINKELAKQNIICTRLHITDVEFT